MNLQVFETLVSFLKDQKVGFKIFEHKPVFTSRQAAKIRGTLLNQGAKALVFLADRQPIMVVVPGDKKVDLKAFKKRFKMRDLRMATPEEVERITGVKIGAVHPFGNLFKIPLFVDSNLSRNEEISFNAGLHEKSIVLKYQDYEKLTKPIIDDFSQGLNV